MKTDTHLNGERFIFFAVLDSEGKVVHLAASRTKARIWIASNGLSPAKIRRAKGVLFDK